MADGNSQPRRIGLGCMRLSTRTPLDDDAAIAVIHAALDAGVTLLDTADAYAPDERGVGHNERLVAAALAAWSGDGSRVTVATKGGLVRPAGAWVPDGRARHLRAAAEASRVRLGAGSIDLYQLHAVDPRVPLATSVRALDGLRRRGVVAQVGLCNITVAQLEAARAITTIDAVQVGLGAYEDVNLRNGVTSYCRDHGIPLLAYRPFGGARSARLAHDAALQEIAARHGTTPHIIVLAWLLDLYAGIIPIPGATRIETASRLGDALAVELSDDDRARLDERCPAGRRLRASAPAPATRAAAAGDVVLVMGMPAAGKSTVAAELVERGYRRLNRDEQGGRVADLIPQLDSGLRAGGREWVLDNTYPTRGARSRIIDTASQHGVTVRCIHVTTPLADAQINAVNRMIEVNGALPDVAELKRLGRTDSRFFGPDALFRFQRQLEPPTTAEGFVTVEERTFARRPSPYERSAAVFELDGVLCTSAAGAAAALDPDDVVLVEESAREIHRLASLHWCIVALAWRPQLAEEFTSPQQVHAVFDRVRQLLAADVDIAYCPHPAGPPVCWCRKPLPGLVLQLAHRHRFAPERSIMFGRAPADRTLAARLGMNYREWRGSDQNTFRLM